MGGKRVRQTGASAIGMMLVLFVIVYGAFVGMQYLPQFIEAQTVDSILTSLRSSQQVNPAASVYEVESRIAGQLNINSMNDLENSFRVSHQGGHFIVDVSYERELNLLFTQKTIQYQRSVTLD